MGTPFVATVVRGVTKGVINLKGIDLESPRWVAGFRLRYASVRQEVKEEIARMQTLSGSGQRFAAVIEPWRGQPSETEDLDLVTRWFMLFQPEKLKAQGVDLDGVKRKR